MLWSEYHLKTAPLGCTAESRKDQGGNKSKTWHLVNFAALYAIYATSYTYHSGIYIIGAKKMSCLQHCSWMVILPLLSPSVLISSPFSSAEWAFQHQEKLFHLIKIWIAQTDFCPLTLQNCMWMILQDLVSRILLLQKITILPSSWWKMWNFSSKHLTVG